VGSGLLVAERQFRRVQGHKQIPNLIRELEAIIPSKSEVVIRKKASQSGSRESRYFSTEGWATPILVLKIPLGLSKGLPGCSTKPMPLILRNQYLSHVLVVSISAKTAQKSTHICPPMYNTSARKKST
jgi:hypothetical protein